MSTYRVVAPTPGVGHTLPIGKIVLWLVLAVVAIVLIRWWGESRMTTRIEERQALASMVTVQATPMPTPTPQAPTLVSAQSVTLDTGLGYSLEYDMRTVADGVRLTDPDGDMWLCNALPASKADWQSCKYVGTVQGD